MLSRNSWTCGQVKEWKSTFKISSKRCSSILNRRRWREKEMLNKESLTSLKLTCKCQASSKYQVLTQFPHRSDHHKNSKKEPHIKSSQTILDTSKVMWSRALETSGETWSNKGRASGKKEWKRENRIEKNYLEILKPVWKLQRASKKKSTLKLLK